MFEHESFSKRIYFQADSRSTSEISPSQTAEKQQQQLWFRMRRRQKSRVSWPRYTIDPQALQTHTDLL